MQTSVSWGNGEIDRSRPLLPVEECPTFEIFFRLMPRIIEYELHAHGWAVGALTLANRRIELDASYLHDTFGDLIEAMLAACEGEQVVEWVYFHEPEATHASLELVEGRSRISLRRYPDLRVPRPRLGDPGALIGEGEVNLWNLVSDVVIAGSRMLERHGEDGYLQSWRSPFPTAQLHRMKQLRCDAIIL